MSVRVLLVDPDESIVDAFAKSLATYGFEVLAASVERDALRYVCESAPKVVVLEPVTPNGWGFKLLRNQDVRMPPTVVLSRWNEDDVSNLSTMNFDQWLTKPVSTKDLATTIERVVHAGS